MKYDSKAKRKSQSEKAPHKLDQLRQVLNVYAQEANSRVSQLIESGVESPAIMEAYKTLRKADREKYDASGEDGVLFSVNDKKRYRELQREASRIMAFLGHADSNVKVAEYEDKALDAYKKHGLSFHNQADEETGIDNIRFRGYDQDKIKLALEIYRRIEDAGGATAIYGNNGKGGFGSDNLFNLIFDEVEYYYPGMEDRYVDRIKANAIATAQAALEEFRHSEMYGFLKGAPKSRRRDQNVLSEMAKSTTAEGFFKRNKWLDKLNF